MIAGCDAFAWVADGEIVIRDEGCGQRAITRAEAAQMATIYAAACADPDLTDEAVTHVCRWMDEIESAIHATATSPMGHA